MNPNKNCGQYSSNEITKNYINSFIGWAQDQYLDDIWTINLVLKNAQKFQFLSQHKCVALMGHNSSLTIKALKKTDYQKHWNKKKVTHSSSPVNYKLTASEMLEFYLTNNLDLIPKYFMTEAQTTIFQQSNKT